jgi:prepilin-type N-terminal cleavage/methylation domain-containing protein
MKKFYRQSGFSLLELLVVISIIGILTAIGAVGFVAAQKRGRDARRRGDIDAISKALEQYYSENTNYDGGAVNCNAAISENMNGSTPTDPKTGASYTTVTCTDSTYCLCADLEVDDGNSDVTNCSAWTDGGDYYCLVNLQ